MKTPILNASLTRNEFQNRRLMRGDSEMNIPRSHLRFIGFCVSRYFGGFCYKQVPKFCRILQRLVKKKEHNICVICDSNWRIDDFVYAIAL